MAVRRRRPLVPPPYPRRNRYTPLSSQSPLNSVSAVSLRLAAKTAFASLLLLSKSKTLRWFLIWLGIHLELGSLSRIVTHLHGEMCYDFVTFSIFRFLPA